MAQVSAPSTPSRRHLIQALAGGFALAAVAPARQGAAQPRPDLWDRWLEHRAGSIATVDHSVWDGWLARYREMPDDGIARVAYDRVTPADRSALDGYVESLTQANVDGLDRPEQYAFWVNLYNAVTVQLILAHFPVRSIRDIDISPGLFANGPWGAALTRVHGTDLTLDDIEHRILRPIWNDPRIHYAVNCAALGCPNLAARAYTGERLDRMLLDGAIAYVNHPRGARLDNRGRLVVSSIYHWFDEDFGSSDAGVIAHLSRYATPEWAEQLAALDDVHDHEYDWGLNI